MRNESLGKSHKFTNACIQRTNKIPIKQSAGIKLEKLISLSLKLENDNI